MIFRIPLRIRSAANIKQHWTKDYAEGKKQEKIVRLYLREVKPCDHCRITLTRIAPRMIDKEDNLPYCFKKIKDVVADILIPGLKMGRADGKKGLEWVYAQKKGKPKEYALEIELEVLQENEE